jgi:hypothetical protein
MFKWTTSNFATAIQMLTVLLLGGFQFAMGWFYISWAVESSSKYPGISDPYAAMYRSISGVWSFGGLATVLLLAITINQELRIARLERRAADSAPESSGPSGS